MSTEETTTEPAPTTQLIGSMMIVESLAVAVWEKRNETRRYEDYETVEWADLEYVDKLDEYRRARFTMQYLKEQGLLAAPTTTA